MLKRKRLLVVGVLGLIIVLAVACGGAAEEPTPTATPTPTTAAETPTTAAVAPQDTAAVEDAVGEVVEAMRKQDRDGLRDLTCASLRQGIRDEDLDELATCFPMNAKIEILGQQVEVSGDTATATVTLQQLVRAVKTKEQCVLEFECEEEGTWVLSALPECPFQ